jgi:hypothetical protein
MPRSVFVSFVFEDKAHFDAVKRWAEEGKLGADVVAIGETKDVRQDGERAIEERLKPRIRGAAAVLLLLGNNTHNHDWVRYELSLIASSIRFDASCTMGCFLTSRTAAPPLLCEYRGRCPSTRRPRLPTT